MRIIIFQLLCFFFFNLFNLTAQFNITQSVPIQPISVCTDTVSFSLTVQCQSLSGSPDNLLNLDFGPGAHYVTGSVVVTSASNGVSGMPIVINVTAYVW